MESGRMPACVAQPLPGNDNTSVPKNVTLSRNNNDNYSSAQVIKLGNRCGHDKNNPTSYLNSILQKKRPYQIIKAQKNSLKCYENPFIFDIGKISFNENSKNRDDSFRKIRSEIRSFIYKEILCCLLHYTCLKTMQFGFTAENRKFNALGINFLHRELQRSLDRQKIDFKITYNRVRKALHILEKAGYINIKENKKLLSNNKFISLPAEILINHTIFIDLGLSYEEIRKAGKSQESDFERYLRNDKLYQFTKNKREKLKSQKKEMKNIRFILGAAKKGENINAVERSILDIELPGHNRKVEQRHLYQDLTGLSRRLALKLKPPP